MPSVMDPNAADGLEGQPDIPSDPIEWALEGPRTNNSDEVAAIEEKERSPEVDPDWEPDPLDPDVTEVETEWTPDDDEEEVADDES